jgi:hypothetical protein
MHESHLRTGIERAVRSIVRRVLRRGHPTSDLERRICSQLGWAGNSVDQPIMDSEAFRRIASRLGDALLGATPVVARGDETVRRQNRWTDFSLVK